MITQKPPTSIRNPFGPRADRLSIAYAVDEATGNGLSNLGLEYPTTSPASTLDEFDGVISDSSHWQSGAEGSFLELKSADSIYVSVHKNTSTTDDRIFLRGTFIIRFSFRSITSGVQALFHSGSGSSTGNRLAIFRVTDTDDLRINFNRAGLSDNTDIIWVGGAATGEIHTLIVTWGEKGFDAWLDGVVGPVTEMPGDLVPGDADFDDSRPLFNTFWSVKSGGTKELRIGRNQQSIYADVDLYTFCMWDYQLHEIEREELFVDPYLPFRPRAQDYSGSDANEILATDVNPIACRPRLNPGSNTDEITFSAVTSKELISGITVYMRILYDTKSDLSSHKISTSSSQIDISRQLNVVIDGLQEGTKYYWVAQYSIDDDEWFYFPGGRGKFYTQNRLSPDFNFVFITDDHIGNTGDGGPPNDDDTLYVGYGGDIVRKRVADGNSGQKLFTAWLHFYDIYVNQDPHFIVHGGDYYMPDNNDLVTLNDGPYTLAKYYRNWCNILFKSGVFCSVQGNHESEGGMWQRENNQGVLQPLAQMLSTVARKTFFPNPTYQTYPQGGENETPTNSRVVDWIPEAGNNWVPELGTSSSTSGTQSRAGTSTIVYDQNYRDEFILGFDTEDEYSASSLYDPYALNRSPLENYYAWTWGDALFVVLDCYRYTEPGDPLNTGGSFGRSGPVWTLGTLQKQWLKGVLSSSTQKWKFVISHKLMGGESIGRNGSSSSTSNWYGRGSGINIKRTKTIDNLFNPYEGYVEHDEEIELHEMFKKFKITAYLKGHDHKFCHVVNEEVNYISGSTIGAPSQWETRRMRDSYGYTEESDVPTGNRLALGIVAASNNLSYLLFQLTENDATYTNRVCAIKAQSTSVDFALPQLGRASWAGPLYTPDSSSQIVLSEIPNDVYTVALASDAIFTPTASFVGTSNLMPNGSAIDQLVNLWPESGLFDDWEEFHGSNVITLDASSVPFLTEDVRVMHVPVDFYAGKTLSAVQDPDKLVVQHNMLPDSAVYVYNINVEGSQEVAEYYRTRRELPADNLIGLDMSIPYTQSCEVPISKDEFESTILIPLRKTIAGLEGSEVLESGKFQCAVIIMGYGSPLSYTEDDGETIAIASRLSRINYGYERKRPNHTYDRRGSWKFYDADDSSQVCLTAVLDGPTVAAVKKLIDRSTEVSQRLFVSGKIFVDPFGKKTTSDQLQYQADILDFVANEAPNLGLEIETTVDESDQNLEPTVAFLKHDSFYWGWFNPTYSKDLFLNQNEKRVFLYNADDDAACQIHFLESDNTPFRINGSDPWCNLAINIEPGYAATAGSVGGVDEYDSGEIGENSFLRPRPFFEALHRGASLAEAFLFSSPFVNWKIILIGDPLMTLTFSSDLPAEQDLNNVLVDNNEVIRRIKEAIEIGLGWGQRQGKLVQDSLDTNVDSTGNIAEEVFLLYGLAEWRNKKDETTFNEIYNTPILGWLGYILKTLRITLDTWLDRRNEKITTRLQSALASLPSRVDIGTDFVYPEGEWEYIFVYTHPRLQFENVHFELEVSENESFTTPVVVGVSSKDDVTGWKYEQEPNIFVQLSSTGFPSNFSGRRVKFVSPIVNYLVRTNVYYVRWRSVETNGTFITDFSVDPNLMLVYR